MAACPESITDSSQAAVPGATVTITNKQSGAMRSAVSGSDGSYSVPDLEPGRYTVVIELSGFQKVSNDDVLVLLGRTFTVNAQLTVGNVSETVNVTAAEKQIDLKSVDDFAQRHVGRVGSAAEGPFASRASR